MLRVMTAIRVCGFIATWSLAGCVSARPQSTPVDRASQTSSILAEVLRYEIRQFTPEGAEAAGASICVAVRDGTGTGDPDQNVMQQLGQRVRPRSKCAPNAVTVVAGPIDWLRDDETRVKGALLQAREGERPLAYRVVLENRRWVCAGQILSWDPL
jgi:hypothetical protein